MGRRSLTELSQRGSLEWALSLYTIMSRAEGKQGKAGVG